MKKNFDSRKEVHIMITVEGSANENIIDSQIISNSNSLKDTTSDITPQSVIKTFMRSLDNATSSDATTMLDDAIKACSSFTGINDAINHFMNHLKVNGSSKFLTDCCGIILNNTDTGAITGSDAGCSTSSKTASSIVPETGSLDTTFTDSSFTTEPVPSPKISPNGQFSALLRPRLCCNHAARCRVRRSPFAYRAPSPKRRSPASAQFYTSSSDGVLASVGSSYDTSNGKTTNLTLNINMNYYSDITSSSINENGTSSKTSAYLDRVLAHELTHALMAANLVALRIF